MPRTGPTAPTILALFDEALGGLAAPSSVVAEILRQRAERQRELGLAPFIVSKSNLLHTLDRLAKSGELSKIPRPKGGVVYTRPRNLETIPGFRGKLETLPALDIRRRASTTDRRYELRKERALKALGDEAVRAGSHDFRYNFKTNRWYPCRTCGRDANGRFGPCKLRISPKEAAKTA